MSLIDIKEHLIQEIKWLKFQIDCVENEEEENEMCYDCGYNPDNDYLQPNSNGAEQSSDIIDLYSNGFRIMGDDSNGWNKDGETYCYAAFGQAVVGTNNIPTTAR